MGAPYCPYPPAILPLPFRQRLLIGRYPALFDCHSVSNSPFARRLSGPFPFLPQPPPLSSYLLPSSFPGRFCPSPSPCSCPVTFCLVPFRAVSAPAPAPAQLVTFCPAPFQAFSVSAEAFFTFLSRSDPKRAKFESFQSYFLAFCIFLDYVIYNMSKQRQSKERKQRNLYVLKTGRLF